jgi:hypothetical protein
MLLLLAASLSAYQDIGRGEELFGRYLATNLTTRPRCDNPSDRYVVISRSGIDWGDGKTDSLIRLEMADPEHFHLWAKESGTGKAVLYGLFIDRNHDRALVISDERAVVQAQIDHSAADVGASGYARCP